MDDTIITIYCLCDDFLKAMCHRRDDPQSRLSTAEVMTIPLVASTYLLRWPDRKNPPVPV
jgi:hypothetical protein